MVDAGQPRQTDTAAEGMRREERVDGDRPRVALWGLRPDYGDIGRDVIPTEERLANHPQRVSRRR
jgi:hypothetical protein